ncbi:MAG TPA: nitrite reductase [Desulfobulbaceae bacterium]|nr:nitrite reductase [Desulfobulbaceae bacterium]
MTTKENPKTFCPMPGINAGMLTLQDLERITELVRKYNVPMVKVTGAQRFFFHGLEPEKHKELVQELGLPPKPPHARNRVHYVQACPGKNWCKFGIKSTEEMSKAIADLELAGPLPYKVKVGISGCRMCCCESWMRDIGLVAEKNGWRLSFGGNAASKPRIGDLVADGLSDDEAVEMIKKTLNYYLTTAKYKTRSARFMERVGIEELKKNVLG